MGATDTITLNRILTNAAGLHASDVHFIIGTQPTIRVDGKLVTMTDELMVTPEVLESIAAVLLTAEQRAQLATEKEVMAAVSLNAQLRFKVTAYLQRGSLAINIHLISSTVRALKDLGFPEAVQALTGLTKGLVLITGPYGSGKSSTVHAFVNEINSDRSANIVTIEQPIEFLYVNNQSIIEQREIGRDAVSSEQAIVSASREDVDVIVISEANTPVVIGALLEAAEASHLVISTMNTDSVLSTVEKIIDSFPGDDAGKIRSQLANVLAAVISQRLIPKVGGGLVLVSDILIPTPPVRSVMRDGALFQLQNVIQTSRQPGVQSFDRTLLQLVQDGTITPDEAMRNAQDPATFRVVPRS